LRWNQVAHDAECTDSASRISSEINEESFDRRKGSGEVARHLVGEVDTKETREKTYFHDAYVFPAQSGCDAIGLGVGIALVLWLLSREFEF
jgi:hypothetical protein